MSTFFLGEGNLGGDAEYQLVPKGNDEPRHVLRLNVYFDNPVPRDSGYQDRGGYWAPVDLWHKEAEHWATLYQRGMRVLVVGRTVRDEWTDREGGERVTFKIDARSVAILPHRLGAITMRERTAPAPADSGGAEEAAESTEETEVEQAEPSQAAKRSRKRRPLTA